MRRLLSRAVLLCAAAQLLLGCLAAVATGGAWLRDGWRNRKDDPAAALARVRGAAYAGAVAAIRARIPRDGAYLSVDADPKRRHDELVWLRYDLAPRKGEYLGRLSGGRLADRRELPPDLPPFVVVSYGGDGEAPRVSETAAFLAACAEGRAR